MTVNTIDEVQICNAALALIGEDAINSIESPETNTESTCGLLFRGLRDFLLSDHEWNFGLEDRTLAVDLDAPAVEGWKYAHKLPSNLLAGPFAVWGDGSRRPVSDYEVIGNWIYSNYAVVRMRGRINPPIAIWPAYFVSLMEVGMAARLAKPVADDADMATEYRIQAFGAAVEGGRGGMYASARRIDAQSQPMASIFQNGDPLTAMRY